MNAFKYFIRIVSITTVIIWSLILANAVVIPFNARIKYFQGMAGLRTVIQVIFGIVLAQMLCSDKKDLTNPNRFFVGPAWEHCIGEGERFGRYGTIRRGQREKRRE